MFHEITSWMHEMLGSHFDLAKEIAAIASKRNLDEAHAGEPREETTKAYADFDRKVRDFVELIAPMSPPGGSRPIVGPFLDRD